MKKNENKKPWEYVKILLSARKTATDFHRFYLVSQFTPGFICEKLSSCQEDRSYS